MNSRYWQWWQSLDCVSMLAITPGHLCGNLVAVNVSGKEHDDLP